MNFCTKDSSMHSTLHISGMFHEQKMEVLTKAKNMIENMTFLAKNQANFCVKPFQDGLLTTINGTIMIHEDLKNIFNEPYLLAAVLNQDELERTFGTVRGLGGGFSLHPKGLEYLQRLGQLVKLILLKYKSFNVMSLKKHYNVQEGQIGADDPDDNFSAHPDAHFRFFYSDIECGGIDEIAYDLTKKFNDVEFSDDLKNDLKSMYSWFNAHHPKNGLRNEKNLISGM